MEEMNVHQVKYAAGMGRGREKNKAVLKKNHAVTYTMITIPYYCIKL